MWGTADSVDIEDKDLELLEECLKITQNNGLLLFAAKKVGMRPQGSFYSLINKKDWNHFDDDCGQEREIGFGNPNEHP